MTKNEIKELNRVELEENYLDTIKDLKNLKSKLLLLKTFGISNIGVGAISLGDIPFSIHSNSNISKILLLSLISAANLALFELAKEKAKSTKINIDNKKDEKTIIEKEIKVRNFIKNRNITYQIWHSD